LNHGIGLTDLVKGRSGLDDNLESGDFDIEGFRGKIREFSPKIVCFNGKEAAKIFFHLRSINYGIQNMYIDNTKTFVAPSTSGAAKRYWDIEHWKKLAKLFKQEDGVDKIKSFDDAHDNFYKVIKSLSKAHTFVKGLAPQMRSEALKDLATLDKKLDIISQTIDDLRWHFCSNPLEKLRTAQQLNREEVYLLAAQGVITIPSKTGVEEA